MKASKPLYHSDGAKGARDAGKKNNVIVPMLLFAVVLGIALAVYTKSQGIDIGLAGIRDMTKDIKLFKENEKLEQKFFEMDYNPRMHPVFVVYKGLIIKCDRESLRGINKKGEEVWSKALSMNDPIVKTNGSQLIVADLDGKDILVLEDGEAKWEQKADGSIINVHINRSGYVTVVYELKGFRCAVAVFDPRGMEMFTRKIAENFVVDAKVSPSGEQFLINAVDAKGPYVNASIGFFDMMGNPFAARIPKEGEIFPVIWYLDDDSVLAAGNSLIIYYDSERNEKWRKEFSSVYSAGVSSGKYIVVAVENEAGYSGLGGKTTHIGIYNVKGQEIASCDVGGQVKNIRQYSGLIAANTVREVFFINNKGRIIGKYSSKTDIVDICFFDKLEALVITKSNIAVIRIE